MTLSRSASPIIGANSSPANSRGQHPVRIGKTNRILASLLSRSSRCWRCRIKASTALSRACDITWKPLVVSAISAIHNNIALLYAPRNLTRALSQLYSALALLLISFIPLLFTGSAQHERIQNAQFDVVELQLCDRDTRGVQAGRRAVAAHCALPSSYIHQVDRPRSCAQDEESGPSATKDLILLLRVQDREIPVSTRTAHGSQEYLRGYFVMYSCA